jgi:hypothetical protein
VNYSPFMDIHITLLINLKKCKHLFLNDLFIKKRLGLYFGIIIAIYFNILLKEFQDL